MIDKWFAAMRPSQDIMRLGKPARFTDWAGCSVMVEYIMVSYSPLCNETAVFACDETGEWLDVSSITEIRGNDKGMALQVALDILYPA